MILYIFDLDGTLADRETGALLPGVAEWFAAHRPDLVAIATNQGGVGLRYWMERDGFGEPSAYPTEHDVNARVQTVVDALVTPAVPYVSLAYQSKKTGAWGPTPPGREDDPRWSPWWRKPAPGMLLRAMADFGVPLSAVIFIGDSGEDRLAAEAAGVQYQHPNEFFGKYIGDKVGDKQ